MNLIGAFCRLIRLPNLVFIALTQVLFYYFVIIPQFSRFPAAVSILDEKGFFLLVLASVCIAAGGYIINDYFDLNIDKVNRPSEFVIERKIRRRWAIAWHIIFSILGLAISAYVGYRIQNLLLPLMNALAVLLLWFYSTSFKRKLLIGNIVISLLTAWVVLVLYLCETRSPFVTLTEEQRAFLRFIFKVAVLYGSFAFIISLAREVVKDMQDLEGDALYNCRTMPIVWGLQAAKVFTAVWMIVLAGALLILVIYGVLMQWWLLAAYVLILIWVPVMMVLRRLAPASHTSEFAEISALIKTIMFTGILSMIFFKYYYG